MSMLINAKNPLRLPVPFLAFVAMLTTAWIACTVDLLFLNPNWHSQWDAMRERSVGLFLVTGCRGLQCAFRRIHSSVHSYLHSSQLRGIAIHTSLPIHGDERVYSVPRTQLGINPFIGHPSGNWITMTLQPPLPKGLPAKAPHPSFLGKAKRRTSSRCQSKGRFFFI